MFDTHIHTKVSADSKMEILDAIRGAEEKGLGLIITEHMDLKYPAGLFEFETKKYFESYTQYKSDNLLLGIEMGMRDDCLEDNNKIIEENKFDYVLGSIHVVNGIDIYPKPYYEGKSKQQSYEEYLKCMYNCVKIYDTYDSLAHIDYISRYAPYDDREIYYRDYSDYIDEIMRVLIEKEKAIEINTRRLNQPVAFENMMNVYNRYRELGGKYVTVGSDSHCREDVGGNFEEALHIIKSCNLHNVYFKERKMEYVRP